MLSSHRLPVCFAFLCLAAQGFLLAPVDAQVTYLEAETAGGQNDTFALAEDCRQIGSLFVIKGRVHSGNSNSDDEWYMFNGAGGACVMIDFNITQPTAVPNPYQLNVWLYNSSQTLVAAWSTGSAASSASFGIGAYTLPATDTYSIYVTEWSVAPNALSQPGIAFTPLSVRGFAVTGTTPDATRNNAGGNQTFGSLYEITVRVSAGNEAPFDVWIDRDPTSGTFVCSPSPASICWVPGGAPNVRFKASPKCPPTGVAVSIFGGGMGLVLPGAIQNLVAPGPEISTTYTVDDGMGPQPGGQIHAVQTLVRRNGQTINRTDVCAGIPICLDVCAPAGSTYVAALSETLGPPIPVPFLSPLELDINSFLFNATFPVNQLSPVFTGSQGQPGVQQICFALPAGVVTTQVPITMQVAAFTPSGLAGLSPKVTLVLVP